MKLAKQWGKVLAACAFALAAGNGCVGIYGPDELQWVDPRPDGYYTGVEPKFAERGNPDPLGRKFRVAFLQAFPHPCMYIPNNLGYNDRVLFRKVFPDSSAHLTEYRGQPGYHLDTGELRPAVEKELAAPVFSIMPCREQAVDSQALKRHLEIDSPEGVQTLRKTGIEQCRLGERVIAQFLANTYDPDMTYSMSSPVDHAFLEGYPSEAWTRKLNQELAARYPALFSSDVSAFPLDVWIVVAFDRSGRECFARYGPERIRSLYEAWLLGLPEHAAVTFHDTVTQGAVFPAVQAYTDPYDAIAAAVFKLTEAQLEGLEPANPNDHIASEEE